MKPRSKPMLKRILDSHHHLWDYDPDQYPWIPKESTAAQSYNLNDMAEHAGPYHVQATIAVHARQTLQENDWLINQAKRSTLCKGVVGWAPVLDERINEVLASYENEPLFKGVRYAIQNEKDPHFMLRPAFLRGLKAINKIGLRYDILIYSHQLPNTIKMVDLLPDDMPFVLDHIAKPTITPNKVDEQWVLNLAELEHLAPFPA